MRKFVVYLIVTAIQKEREGLFLPQRAAVIPYGRFETNCRFHLRGSRLVTAEYGEGSSHDIGQGVQGHATDDKTREGTSLFTQLPLTSSPRTIHVRLSITLSASSDDHRRLSSEHNYKCSRVY